jgi:uncharacterized protein YqhQ
VYNRAIPPYALRVCKARKVKAVAEYNYGGQAVIEGVMMRGARRMAVAIRTPTSQIVVHSEPLDRRIYASSAIKLPFLRSIPMLWDTVVLGIRILLFSANVAMGEMDTSPAGVEALAGSEPGQYFSGPMAWGTIAMAFVAAVVLFFVGPMLLISLVDRFILSSLLSNVLEGLIRLAFLLLYIYLISFIPDIRRVFAYHGAEHKTINAYEGGAPLTPENVQRFSVLHPRCGTAFLLVVVVIAIVVFALLGRPPFWLRVASRIFLIPVVAGLAYEFIRFSARRRSNPLMRLAMAPGLALQQLTTREPDDSMLEVAIAAFKRLLAEDEVVLDEKSQAATGTPPAKHW